MQKTLKILFLIIGFLIFFSILAHAGEVTLNEAKQVAQNYLTANKVLKTQILNKTASIKVSNIVTFTDPESNYILYYIASLSPEGFIVISAEKDIEPIIAYSYTHNWNSDTSCCNVLYHMLRKDMKMRKESLKYLSPEIIEQNNLKWQKLTDGNYGLVSYSFKQWPEEGTTSTGGWLETTWHQYSPYNNYCPLDPNSTPMERSVVGCVATAMAQIVNYHKNIGDLAFSSQDKYVTDTRFGLIGINIDSDSLKLDFPSFKMLNNFLNGVKDKYINSISLSDDEIAALNFACGILLKTDYNCTGSGTGFYKMADAIQNRLLYSSAELIQISDMEFYNRIKNDIMNAFPVALNIISSFY